MSSNFGQEGPGRHGLWVKRRPTGEILIQTVRFPPVRIFLNSQIDSVIQLSYVIERL